MLAVTQTMAEVATKVRTAVVIPPPIPGPVGITRRRCA